MSPKGRRDHVELAGTLESWFAARLGLGPVSVSDLSVPKAGFSNETVLGTAAWAGHDGAPNSRRFVLRVEPTDHQLFVEPDAMRQARVMQELAGQVPVPTVWLTETDRSVLGAAFFVMDTVEGRVPSDVPSWHAKGWTTRLTPEERHLLYDNGLAAMAALHRAERTDGLAFLEPAGDGTPLDRYLAHVAHWYQWSEPVRRYGTDVLDAAFDYVQRARPADAGAVVTWGDARPGNIIFAEDLTVAAMVDWEGATIAPVGVDVGWWLMFEQFLCEAQGLTRLDGVPDRKATLARYEELSGTTVPDVDYYEVLAGLVFALINSKLAALLIAGGQVGEDVASEFVTRVTTMTAKLLP
jgi:aminoglycoside phosphotransferase (APT) family kinase protein